MPVDGPTGSYVQGYSTRRLGELEENVMERNSERTKQYDHEIQICRSNETKVKPVEHARIESEADGQCMLPSCLQGIGITAQSVTRANMSRDTACGGVKAYGSSLVDQRCSYKQPRRAPYQGRYKSA